MFVLQNDSFGNDELYAEITSLHDGHDEHRDYATGVSPGSYISATNSLQSHNATFNYSYSSVPRSTNGRTTPNKSWQLPNERTTPNRSQFLMEKQIPNKARSLPNPPSNETRLSEPNSASLPSRGRLVRSPRRIYQIPNTESDYHHLYEELNPQAIRLGSYHKPKLNNGS